MELDLGMEKGKVGHLSQEFSVPLGGNQCPLGQPHPTTLHSSHILGN